jgi:hypothetical protein
MANIGTPPVGTVEHPAPNVSTITKMDRPVRHRARLTVSSQTSKAPVVTSSSQKAILLEILNKAALFHTPDGTAYADIKISGHRETWKVRSSGFRDWLTDSFYRRTGGAPSSDAMQQAIAVADLKARRSGVERCVHVRVGGDNGKIYLDMADANWRAIRIDANGWSVVPNPEVRFIRSKGMLPVPLPLPGGSINKLRDFINVKADEDFALVVAWVLAALRDTGPYPVLTAIGEQGSAKSTLMVVLRSLIDPNVANLRSPPREERDLFIAAQNAHVLAYDNLSGLPSWLSDGLARISTGAAHATRRLYADEDEVLMQAENPIALNGITDIVNRADLADRCIFVTADRIADKDRRPKRELLIAFEAERPSILGALLDAVAHGIKTLPTVQDAGWPRMADFAKWATACEGAFATPGSFKAAYASNRREAIDTLLDDDLVVSAVQKHRLPWQGRASELLAELNAARGYAHVNAKEWPKDGKALSSRLIRLAPLLRAQGINAEKFRTSAARGWRLTATDQADGRRGLASPMSLASLAKTANGTANDGNPDGGNIVSNSVTGNPLGIRGSDADDARDAKSARLSGQRPASTAEGCGATATTTKLRPALPVLSDIDAAYEELSVRREIGAQLPPSAQPKHRYRARLSASAGNAPKSGQTATQKYLKRGAL